MSSTFTIDAENEITACASGEEASRGDATGLAHFDSQAALAKVSAEWTVSRLIEIWNSIPGQTPVKKFHDRKSEQTALGDEGLSRGYGRRSRRSRRMHSRPKPQTRSRNPRVKPGSRPRRASPAPLIESLESGTQSSCAG